MCVVVKHLTRDFIRLVTLLKSCNGKVKTSDQRTPVDVLLKGRLQQAIKRPATNNMDHNEVRTLSILIFIVDLLGEHCDFDRLRAENTGASWIH